MRVWLRLLGGWRAEGSSHFPPCPQVEALLPPVEGGLAHHQLPAPPPHHPDGGPPLLLRSVDPLHLIHLPIEGFCEVAGEVEIKVLKGLLMSFVLVASTYSSNQFVSVRMRAA